MDVGNVIIIRPLAIKCKNYWTDLHKWKFY